MPSLLEFPMQNLKKKLRLIQEFGGTECRKLISSILCTRVHISVVELYGRAREGAGHSMPILAEEVTAKA